MKVAVTGAGGFVGRPLVTRLRDAGHEVVPLVRTPSAMDGERVIGAIEEADWGTILPGTDAIVHLAARVHVMRDEASDPLSAYRRVNCEATLRLAKAAAAVGARRFLFLSTIKVLCEATLPGRPFRRDDPPAPADPYAVSKYEAERGLASLSREAGIEAVVIRPPLIHGPGAGGNLAALMGWVKRGIPMPLGAIRTNRRSLVGIDNLVDLLAVCLSHPRAPHGPWLVSDDRATSTRELIELIAAAMKRRPRLFPLPPAWLRALGVIFGSTGAVERLLGNLEIDMSATLTAMNWRPRLSLEDGIDRMARSAP